MMISNSPAVLGGGGFHHIEEPVVSKSFSTIDPCRDIPSESSLSSFKNVVGPLKGSSPLSSSGLKNSPLDDNRKSCTPASNPAQTTTANTRSRPKLLRRASCSKIPDTLRRSRSTSRMVQARAQQRQFDQGISNTIHNSGMTTSIRSVNKLQIAQRSTSSRTVKQVLLDLEASCKRQEFPSSSSSNPPELECAMIAQLVVDAYYRVVISKNGGVTIIRSVMKAYPENESIQASCCKALGLCVSGGSTSTSSSSMSQDDNTSY